VFDKGQQQRSRPPASDLSRSLVELSRKYGLHVELETEGEAAAVGSPEKCDDTAANTGAKTNILSAVRGQAQRLWQQRQLMFKGSDSGDRVDVSKEIVDGDVESGRVDAVHTDTAAPVQKSTCSVTTVNETAVAERPNRNLGGSLRYRTLEYGASPADAEAQSSSDSGVQCCTVNPSAPVSATDKDATAAVTVTADDRDVTAADKVVTAAAPIDVAVKVDEDEAVKAKTDEAVADPDKNAVVALKTVDDGSKPVAAQPKNVETKHTNPPPPPPRKYSASVVAPSAAVTVPLATTAAATSAASVSGADNGTAPPEPRTSSVTVACLDEPVKKPSVAVRDEIRVDDDYYWCTTTAMAPPMSTFGKRPSTAPASGVDGSGRGGAVVEQTEIVGDASTATVSKAHDKGAAVSALTVDDADGGRDVVIGVTTSIEDASLPSFSSDEEEDDQAVNCNGAMVFDDDDKPKLPPCSSVGTLADGVGIVTGGGNDGSSKGGGTVKKTDCNDDYDGNRSGVAPTGAAAAEPKSATKLPTLRLSLSSPLSSTATTSCSSSSASSTSSTSPSPTNSSGTINSSPIVSKIPVRRQSAGSGAAAVSTPLANGTAKKSIPLPLSRSGSRLAMWSSAN